MKLSAAATLLFVLANPALAESVWYVGATLHPVESPAIPDGSMQVEDGRIVAIGAGLTVPPGARTVDLNGKHLYPGFVHAGSPIGLVEVNSVRGTVDTTEIGANNAHLRVEVAFNADSQLLPPALAGGVLTANVVATGGLVSPASAVMSLAGWNWRDMTMRSRAAVIVDYPALTLDDRFADAKAKDEFEKTKKERLADLDELFDRARAWSAARAAERAGTGPRVEDDAALEALGRIVAGEMPIFLRARERRQIAAALDWAEKQKLSRRVLLSGPDAVTHAERLARAEIPVVIEETIALPGRPTDPYDDAYSAAGRLHAAGVTVALGDGGDASNARNLPFQAAMAAAFGLPEDVALRSVTLTPAEILGVADRVGSLAPGKDASFFVSNGDPLEIRTSIERVFVRGEEIDLERDRQRQLWRRYANRPALK